MLNHSKGNCSKVSFLSFLFCFVILFASTGYADVVINDVTQINPITMQDVIAPTSIDEIVNAVKSHTGPISIGGGRYSMGGQTATENGIQIDMRQMNKVLAFSKDNKEVTVQAGITWRALQEYIDPYDLSVEIMQTYDNFTVGGSLSVNAHGRYVGKGPLVYSVKSIHVVLADGSLVNASPTENSDIFYGAIGGYGGLGVIVDATLELADDIKVERQSTVMPISAYAEYFAQHVENDPNVVFHNADIYPDDYEKVRATSYVKTDKPVTIPDHMIPIDKSYWRDRFLFNIISEWPFGKEIRQHIIDPMLFSDNRVEWRNYEASYRVEELEPSSRKSSTYVLQEYFVPTENFDKFRVDMRDVLRSNHVNVINVSIRHAHKDPGTLLAWAQSDVFAFVLYYKQGTTDDDKKAVGSWTRQLIDRVIASGGSYYLPYQIQATVDQFHAAYPNADKFFALKQKLDPTNKFRNKLWNAYYQPQTSTELAGTNPDPKAAKIKAEIRKIPGYARDEGQTYLTFPEWFIVYSPDEYAKYLKTHTNNSDFPYFGSIGQTWGNYHDVYAVTKQNGYPTNWGYHLMIGVISSSYSTELAVKGIYENSIGRITEWTAGGKRTPEDNYAAQVAQEYVDFIRVYPWYEFSFMDRFKGLWAQTDPVRSNRIRRWERRGFLSLGYLFKAGYGGIIKLATKAIYGDADAEMMVLTKPLGAGKYIPVDKVKVYREFNDGSKLLILPRYEEFRDAITQLAQQNVSFREIAGNQNILMTLVVPAQWTYQGEGVEGVKQLFSRPILTHPEQKRIAVNISVPQLDAVIRNLKNQGMSIEHIYDY